MARDEIEGRKKAGDDFQGPTGEKMTEERVRDRESATGRAGGTGRIIRPEEEEEPKKTAGTHTGKKPLDGGGI